MVQLKTYFPFKINIYRYILHVARYFILCIECLMDNNYKMFNNQKTEYEINEQSMSSVNKFHV